MVTVLARENSDTSKSPVQSHQYPQGMRLGDAGKGAGGRGRTSNIEVERGQGFYTREANYELRDKREESNHGWTRMNTDFKQLTAKHRAIPTRIRYELR